MKKRISILMVIAMLVGLFAGMPPKVEATDGPVDILEYSSHTNETEFGIYNIEGMNYLADLVNEEGVSLKDKIINLQTCLEYDKSKENNYTPIGTEAKQFEGKFNGNYYVISGINLHGENKKGCAGIFGYTGSFSEITTVVLADSIIHEFKDAGGIVGYSEGNIKNCIIAIDVKIINCDCAGGIAGYSWTSPISDVQKQITGCANYGAIICDDKNDGSSAGGIVGQISYGIVSGCINEGNITTNCNAGGICGVAWGDIYECCNYGQIDSISGSRCDISLGGISGADAENRAEIINCYNVGEIGNIDNGLTVGGISGSGARTVVLSNYEKKYIIKNVYNVGNVYGYDRNYASVLATIHEYFPDEMNYVYWLTGTAPDGVHTTPIKNMDGWDLSGVHEYTESKMKSQSFVDELNANSVKDGYGEVWTSWTADVNDRYNIGYPLLKNVPYNLPEIKSPSGKTVPHIYNDYNFQNQLADTDVKIYANGSKDAKMAIIYTDILASYIYTTSNGVVKASTGKVIVGLTTSETKPTVTKNKIDSSATKKIATASIKSGQITITAKSTPGTVYLWVIDTGDVGTYTCCPVTVKGYPSKLTTVSSESSTVKYTKANIKVSESVDVYLNPMCGTVKADNGTYSATVASNATSYISVTQISNTHFRITAKSLKNDKKVSGKVTFKCEENGKKTTFTATVTK